MSSSKNNTTYKKTSFLAGNNFEFINEFYADFLSDPSSLPESWRRFFEGLSEEQKLIYKYLSPLAQNDESLKLENDAAIINLKKKMIVSSDMMVEDTHF